MTCTFCVKTTLCVCGEGEGKIKDSLTYGERVHEAKVENH